MADKAEKAVGNPMKFPYTFSAKIAQFPMKHYIKNQWIWRYYFVALGVCPQFRNFEAMAPSTAFSKLAESNTINGALPPNSRETRLTVSAHWRYNSFPTSVEPVNDMVPTS
uniref:Uncharacterized protein n=1 Tax=Glossina austeni TaxID=7395 RepID=A0A1A9VYD4_GLOAU